MTLNTEKVVRMSHSEKLGAEDARAIFCDLEHFTVSDGNDNMRPGVWLADDRTDLLTKEELLFLRWHPLRALDREGLSSLAHPSLPIPFTARELAAVFLAGRGSVVAELYGNWEDGPDEDQLQEHLDCAEAAQRAVRGAFQALREAQAEVGALDTSLDARAKELCDRCEAMRRQARREFGVDQRLKDAMLVEATETTEESIRLHDQLRNEAWGPFNEWCASPDFVHAKDECEKAQREADAARAAWLKKMVQHLLSDEPAQHELVSQPQGAPERRGLKTRAIAEAFSFVDGLHGKLRDVRHHRWLLPARVTKGTAPTPSTWCPLELAKILIDKDVSDDAVNRAFQQAPVLKPWLAEWQETRRERNAFGL